MVTRQKAYRLRRREGLAIFRVTANEDQVVDALIASTVLTESEAADRRNIEEALGAVIKEWSKLWYRK